MRGSTLRRNKPQRFDSSSRIWLSENKREKREEAAKTNPNTNASLSLNDGGGFREGGGGRAKTRETDLFRERPCRRGAEASFPDGESGGAFSPPFRADGLRRHTRAWDRG